jgi:hypothetical protein
MGFVHVRNVIVKTSTPTSKFVCLSLAAVALGVGISWPNAANAQVVDAPPHRLDFTVASGLPKCSNYDEFYGILVNWVSVGSIDPTAKRRLVVDIKRLGDGKKRVQLDVLDPQGGEVATESHTYSSTEECFKILYWTGFDAAKLLRLTVVPPDEEPPMSVDKLVEESEKPDQIQGKRSAPIPTTPIYDAEFYSDPKPAREQCDAREAPRSPSKHVLFGAGATVGLTWRVMPGLRVGVGRPVGPFVLEVDARAYLPLDSAEKDMGDGQRVSARAHAYVASGALCVPGGRLLGCFVASGGFRGYIFDEPYRYDERFSKDTMGGLFDVGLRVGAQFGVSRKFALRVDLETLLPIYESERFIWENVTDDDDRLRPRIGAFVSVIPAF